MHVESVITLMWSRCIVSYSKRIKSQKCGCQKGVCVCVCPSDLSFSMESRLPVFIFPRLFSKLQTSVSTVCNRWKAQTEGSHQTSTDVKSSTFNTLQKTFILTVQFSVTGVQLHLSGRELLNCRLKTTSAFSFSGLTAPPITSNAVGPVCCV